MTAHPIAAPARRHAPAEHVHPRDVSLPAALAALSDPTRMAIVQEIAAGEDWERACGSFDVQVTKATLSHHFAVLRAVGLIEQRDVGPKRFSRLRRVEFGERFPGLLELVIRESGN